MKYNGLEIFFTNLEQYKMKNRSEFNQTIQFWQVAEVKASYYNQAKVMNFPKIIKCNETELILHHNWCEDLELLVA